MEQPSVFINSIVLCREVTHHPRETGTDFLRVFHSLVLDYSEPNFEITTDVQLCINAVVQDASEVHEIQLGIKSPAGREEMLGKFLLAVPIYSVSATQIPMQLTLREEGLHWLYFFLKGKVIARYGLAVASDTILD